MGAPTGVGGTLPQQVQGAYQTGLGQYGQLGQAGGAYMAGTAPYIDQAGGAYGQMANIGVPQSVQAAQLGTTNLAPYMNPYQQNVIDTTMSELNRQRDIALQGVDDRAQAQNAFGGDRMYLERGTTAGDYARQQANTLAQLNQGNFNTALQSGQFDVGQQNQVAQANQNMLAQLFAGGAQGLGQLGMGGGQLGLQGANNAAAGLANMAGSGFTMANAANAAQTAAAQAQQQQQQQAIDAANANYARLLGIPQSYLQSMLGIASGMGNFGTTKGAQSTDPGLLSYLGAGAGILGAIAGIPV